MTVRIAKPAVNIREKLAELERPIGLNGSALMRTETPQEAFNLIGAGRRNLIINGNFSISQRGDYTSSTAIAASGYFLDRWLTIPATGATIQHKKNQVLPNGDITNSALATVTSANGYTGFEQFIEFPEAYSGQTFTVSFWIKTNYHLSEINIYNGSSYVFGSSTGGTLNESSGQWKFYSKTFTMPSSGNTMFRIEFWTGSATTPIGSYIELAQVQVERGKIATPFEYRSYAEELAMCQRYFYKYGGTSEGYSSNGAVFPLHRSSNNVYFISGVHPVQMRGTPTLTTSLSSGTYATDLDPSSSQEWNFRDWYVDTRASGSIDIAPEYYGRNWTLKLGTTLSNANASVIFWYGSSTAFIYFNAEL